MIKQLVGFLALGLIACTAKGEIFITISDDGSDLTMRATGSYDISALTPAVNPFAFLGINATVAPSVYDGIYGWETGPCVAYTVSFSDSLTGTVQTDAASSVTTDTPFFFVVNYFGSSYFVLSTGTPTFGTVDETAVFENETIASLGMVVGESVTASWAGDSATIQVVPEPATVGLMVLGGCTVLFRKRKRW
jgi:hypothetical protein